MTNIPIPTIVHESQRSLQGWNDPIRGAINWRTLVSADQTATDSITAGIAEIEPGCQFNLHRHAPPEFYYILAGTGVVTINAVEHSVGSGVAVFIPSNATHGIRNNGDVTLRLLYAFAVDSFAEVEYIFPG